jgi:hypothetical protein
MLVPWVIALHFEKNPQLFFDHWITLLLDCFAVMAADNMADI